MLGVTICVLYTQISRAELSTICFISRLGMKCMPNKKYSETIPAEFLGRFWWEECIEAYPRTNRLCQKRHRMNILYVWFSSFHWLRSQNVNTCTCADLEPLLDRIFLSSLWYYLNVPLNCNRTIRQLQTTALFLSCAFYFLIEWYCPQRLRPES
jgi:hypothetical protein